MFRTFPYDDRLIKEWYERKTEQVVLAHISSFISVLAKHVMALYEG